MCLDSYVCLTSGCYGNPFSIHRASDIGSMEYPQLTSIVYVHKAVKALDDACLHLLEGFHD